jgi:hypothetical protein
MMTRACQAVPTRRNTRRDRRSPNSSTSRPPPRLGRELPELRARRHFSGQHHRSAGSTKRDSVAAHHRPWRRRRSCGTGHRTRRQRHRQGSRPSPCLPTSRSAAGPQRTRRSARSRPERRCVRVPSGVRLSNQVSTPWLDACAASSALQAKGLRRRPRADKRRSSAQKKEPRMQLLGVERTSDRQWLSTNTIVDPSAALAGSV